MTPEDFYNYLTNHMTPEQALKKLLVSPVLSYENLKFDKGKEVHPVLIIGMAALDLGWDITIEKDNVRIEGMTVGKKAYIERVFNNVEKEQ